MAPSSPTTPPVKTTPDPVLAELTSIHQLLDVLVGVERRNEQHLQRLNNALRELTTMLDGFTSSGSSFRSYQFDPMVVAYACILGPILGDRIDANTAKGEAYINDMMQGAAVMARQLLRTLDAYRSERGSLDYLENMAGDINQPQQPEDAS